MIKLSGIHKTNNIETTFTGIKAQLFLHIQHEIRQQLTKFCDRQCHVYLCHWKMLTIFWVYIYLSPFSVYLVLGQCFRRGISMDLLEF
jgi:hypothetical protein